MMLNWNDLLIALLPTLVVAIAFLVLVRWFLKHNLKIRQIELAKQQRAELIPTRLQAYERMALFLERITPESLIVREQVQNITSLEFHQTLLKLIRKEFEHNLAMQIYIPISTWDLILEAREEVVKLINSGSIAVPPHSPSMALSRHLLENANEGSKYHIKKAKEQLKKDVQMFYFDGQ